MKSVLERAAAQFDYERQQHQIIMATTKGPARAKAFTEAYAGLAAGQQRGDFLDQETEPLKKARQKYRLLRRFISPSSKVAECGPGNFDLAKTVAPQVKSLAVIDVIDASATAKLPKNCTFFETDGVHLPADLINLDLVWSSHVVEHIHPDELINHLQDVHRALKPGGHYVVFTPNRLSGPHDISRYFTNTAEGLHLKEYTVRELRRALKKAGYTKILHYAGGKGVYVRVPAFWPLIVELKLSLCPSFMRKFFSAWLPIKALLGIIIVGQK